MLPYKVVIESLIMYKKTFLFKLSATSAESPFSTKVFGNSALSFSRKNIIVVCCEINNFIFSNHAVTFSLSSPEFY